VIDFIFCQCLVPLFSDIFSQTQVLKPKSITLQLCSTPKTVMISLSKCRPNIMTCSKFIFTSTSNNFPSHLEVLQQSKQVRIAIELCVWIYWKVCSAGPNNRLQGRLISLVTLDFVISIYKFRVHINKRYIIM
jgi:hypothetical protein